MRAEVLTEADLALAIVTARLLAQGRWLGLSSVLLSALVLWRLAQLCATSAIGLANLTVALPAALLGLFNLYAAIRVGLDAALFGDLAARRLTPGWLDESLLSLGLTKRSPARSMAYRCRGGLAWFKGLAVGTLLQGGLVVFTQ